jgi:hypothetical protein
MSNCVRPYCRLLNQPNFFLLERAMCELQFLYQTYFSRTNLRRKKSPKPNTSEKVLANSPSRNSIFLFSANFFISEEKWENSSHDIFCSIKSALSNGILEVKFKIKFIIIGLFNSRKYKDFRLIVIILVFILNRWKGYFWHETRAFGITDAIVSRKTKIKI